MAVAAGGVGRLLPEVERAKLVVEGKEGGDCRELKELRLALRLACKLVWVGSCVLPARLELLEEKRLCGTMGEQEVGRRERVLVDSLGDMRILAGFLMGCERRKAVRLLNRGRPPVLSTLSILAFERDRPAAMASGTVGRDSSS